MEDWLLIIIIFTVAGLLIRSLTEKIRQLHHRFDHLDTELREIRQALRVLKSPPAQEKPAAPLEAKPAPVTRAAPPATEPIPAAAFRAAPAAEVKPPTPLAQPFPPPTYGTFPPLPNEPQPGLWARFLRNNPDLEKFIGENLINKIGIAILVLGIGYFVKYAIDQDWINEIGRVFIGILAGGGLVAVAHRLRRKLPAFSSVLVGGSLAVLYFTIAIAFHEYQLFSQTAAFGLMVVITAFSILLSVSYDRVELAVLSLLGGFATPFMLSTGEGNYQVLFTYILILNVGMLVLAYLKGWKIINWIAYGFTILLYGSWLATRVVGVPGAPYLGALIFATLFYLVFFLMNIINNVKERTPFAAADIGILLSNTFLYYSAGMVALTGLRHGQYQGLFTVMLALFNFVFAFALFRSQRADRSLVYLLIGLVITFISLAIPVQLEGNYITMFWALEAVLLLWLYQKSGLKFIFLSSVTVFGLMVISLAMDWNHLYTHLDAAGKPLRVLLNKAFITSTVSLLALALLIRLLRHQNEAVAFRLITFRTDLFRRQLQLALGVLLYAALALELHYQLNQHLDLSYNRLIITGSYNLAYLVGLCLFARSQRQPRLTWTITILGMVGVLAYLVLFNPAVLRLLKLRLLEGNTSLVGFYFHYGSLLLLILLLVMLWQNVSHVVAMPDGRKRLLLWLLCAAAVVMASAELLIHVVYLNYPMPPQATGLANADAYSYYEELVRQTNKVGFPILWGLCAFVLMFIGLRRKTKQLRIIALSLFTLTLLKLFLYDIRGISEGGKIAAFISLGVLLLVISFMYQNLKRLILLDEEKQGGERP